MKKVEAAQAELIAAQATLIETEGRELVALREVVAKQTAVIAALRECIATEPTPEWETRADAVERVQ